MGVDFMSYVLWDIAKNSKESIYWISDECDEQLYCLECNGKMIAVKGEVKQHHFRHSVESNCSGESARHWSKKYQIHQILKEFGVSEVEKAISKHGVQYIADVRFEKEWAFEVVISNPPSDDKFENLKERLIIFDFTSHHWIDDNWFDLGYDKHTLDELVEQIATLILKGDTESYEFPVCNSCRRVLGEYSRAKQGNMCMMCDMLGHPDR